MNQPFRFGNSIFGITKGEDSAYDPQDKNIAGMTKVRCLKTRCGENAHTNDIGDYKGRSRTQPNMPQQTAAVVTHQLFRPAS